MPQRNPREQEYEEILLNCVTSYSDHDDDHEHDYVDVGARIGSRPSSREWYPDLRDSHTLACLMNFTRDSLTGGATFRDWTINNAHLTDKEKMVIKSLRLIYIKPLGMRCIHRGCRNTSLWYEHDLGLYACSIDHIKELIKVISNPPPDAPKKTKKEELYQRLAESEAIRTGRNIAPASNGFYWSTGEPAELPSSTYGELRSDAETATTTSNSTATFTS